MPTIATVGTAALKNRLFIALFGGEFAERMMGRLDRPLLRWWHKREITVPVGDPNDAGQELQFSRSVLSEPAHDFSFSYKKARQE